MTKKIESEARTAEVYAATKGARIEVGRYGYATDKVPARVPDRVAEELEAPIERKGQPARRRDDLRVVRNPPPKGRAHAEAPKPAAKDKPKGVSND